MEVTNYPQLNLSTAIQILEHAGKADPTKQNLDPVAQLQSIIDTLCDLSMHDGLTGLANASCFRASLATEIDRCSRTGQTCALILLDLDHFKLVNDTYGHQTGDLVLKAAAVQLQKSLRSMDLAARIGGEEFAVLLLECTGTDAVRAAERIHGRLNPLVVSAGSLTLNVTMSAGLVWAESMGSITPEALMAQADEELYRAKRSGRRTLCHPRLVPTRLSVAEHASILFPCLEEKPYVG